MALQQVKVSTYTGKLFNCTDVDPKQIDIVDIAHSLSMQCRFNGHTRRFYSVAEHCTIGSYLVPQEAALGFLLHDASEGYLGDIVHPLKVHLPDYLILEEHLQAEIERHYNVRGLNASLWETIHRCDKWQARQEAQSLLNGFDLYMSTKHGDAPIFEPVVKFDFGAIGLPPDVAKQGFLRRYSDLI